MVRYCVLGIFFLYSNLIFPISVKSGNVSDILENEVSSKNNDIRHLFSIDIKKNHVPECDCGSETLDCKYYKDIGKICTCDGDYAQNNQTCEKCNCGLWESNGCIFEKGRKFCNCRSGYAQKDGYCQGCYCGLEASCRFINNRKICDCPRGYAQKYNRCENCECGKSESFSSCSFNATGHKKCNCKEGYAQRNMTCYEVCKTNRDCLNGGYCKTEGNDSFCVCSEHFTGEKCEISVACESMERKCREMRAQCKFDKWEEKPFCECPSNSAFNKDSRICEDCQCGGHAICSFERGKKTCSCEHGYVLNGDNCQKCDCGSLYSKSCSFENSSKVCVCDIFAAYSPKSGKCEHCWCGDGATLCKFNIDTYTRCECEEGYFIERKKGYGNEICKKSHGGNVSFESCSSLYTLVYILSGALVLIFFSCSILFCCQRKLLRTAKKKVNV